MPPAGPRLRSCVAQVVLLRLPQAALVHLGAVQLQEREPVWAGLLPAPLLALLLLKPLVLQLPEAPLVHPPALQPELPGAAFVRQKSLSRLQVLQ